jgi:hypothetical protein
VHGYPIRRYRDRASGENKRIRIVSIRCPFAQKAGKPYTKRLLPDFLIPRCVIRLDYLQQAGERAEAGENIDAVCMLLGCVDARTAAVHLRRFESAVVAGAAVLGERRAMSPELGDLPDLPPDTRPIDRLRRLVEAENRAQVRQGAGRPPITVEQLLQAVLGTRQEKIPLGCASPASRSP